MENEFLEKISYFNEKDLGLAKKALNFATQTHNGQKRLSGEDFIVHPVAAAEIMAEMEVDASTVCAALLHDCIEDGKVPPEKIENEFGPEISFLVESVTNLSKIKYQGQERETENFRKMFLAMAKDIRVILVKLADRLHNMRTLEWLGSEKQIKIAKETMEIYAPLANRLGIGHIKSELEDLCFPVLYPEEYAWLNRQIAQKYLDRKKYLDDLKPIVVAELKKNKIPVLDIHLRAKHLWSLWRKLQRYEMDWGKIYDLVAVRIIVPALNDCYNALGAIHQLWHPLAGRIKDYIATPRPSGYQSLHTTVFAKDGVIVEFQIRTWEMHQSAENGIAAHWIYDEFSKNKKGHDFKPRQLQWIRQLRDWQKTISHSKSEEFMNLLKIDFFKNRIFVFTPKGDVFDLPEEATPVDFAYQVHSDVGNHCVGAKINGKMAALSEKLQNNDIVEIMIQKNKKPSADWLEFVKTSEARRHIQQILQIARPKMLSALKDQKIQIKITFRDRIGLMNDIISLLSKNKININSSSSGEIENKKEHFLLLNISAPASCDLNKTISQIKKVKSVLQCAKIPLY